MPRKKLSAPNIVLFAGPSPAISVHTTSNIKEVYGLQGFNFEMNSSKEDVYSAGTRAALSRQSLDPDSVSFDFSYNFSNFDNEKSFGFSVAESSGIIAPLLDGTADERNFFLMIAADGQDAIGSPPSSTPCLGFGNATLSSYSFNAAVGAYPTSTVSFQAVDAAYYEDSDSQILPAINISTNSPATGLFTLPAASGNFGQRDPVLRPWDIRVNLSGASGLFHNLSTACIQSVDINFDLGRENQLCLGKKWRNESNIADSIPVNFSLEILAKDMVTGRLSNFTCETGNYRAIVTVKRPSCNGNGSTAAIFDLKGLTWENQNQSIDRGSDSTVTLNFQSSIGGANETNRGLFISDGSSVIITVADEAARYALTGISAGQLVMQEGGNPSNLLVSGAGDSEVDGEYSPRGTYMDFAYYNKVGQPSDPLSHSIYNEEDTWYMNAGDGVLYSAGGTLHPWGGEWIAIGDGTSPAPTVTEIPRTNVVYRLLAPSPAQGGVFVSGGTQDGIYEIYELGTEATLRRLGEGLDGDAAGGNWFTRGLDYGEGVRWTLAFDGSPVYYSLSDVASPDLATDWKNASDDSPAGITVTSVSVGELNAGVTVAGAGSASVNGPQINTGSTSGRPLYTAPSRTTQCSGSEWTMNEDNEVAGTAYTATAAGGFPWGLSWDVLDGSSPAPTVTRNDICAPSNWEVV